MRKRICLKKIAGFVAKVWSGL